MADIYFIFAFLINVVLSNGLNITMIPASGFDDVDAACTNQSSDSSSLFPRSILIRSNLTSLIDMMNISESAWIGGERFIRGCQNDSAVDYSRLCTEIVFERLPGYTKLNYSCVDTFINVRKNSPTEQNIINATNFCTSFGWSLPTLSINVPTYQLPDSLQLQERGHQWFKSVGREYLKGSVARKCPMVTRKDECNLLVKYVDCETDLRGVCMSVSNVQFHDSLLFEEYTDDISTREVPTPLTEEALCYEEKTSEAETTPAIDLSTVGLPDARGHVDYESTEMRDNEVSTVGQPEMSTKELEQTTGKTVDNEPSPKPKRKSSDSNKLWILAVILITLAIIAIIVLIMKLRHQKQRRSRSGQFEEDGNKRSSTSSRKRHSTNDVSSPLAGSMRKIQDKNNGPQRHESGIEVVISDQFDELHGHDIVVKDLDEDVVETKFEDNDDVKEISVRNSVKDENKESNDTNMDDGKNSLIIDNEPKEDSSTQDSDDNQTSKDNVNENTGSENDEKQNDYGKKEENESSSDEKSGLIVDIEDTL